jgi:DNA-binding ferritin-like protein (Dps family)
MIMGAVFRPKDLQRDYKKIIENAIKDLSPDAAKDNNINVIKLLDFWKEGIISEEKLKEVLGHDKAEELLKNIKAKKEANLTNEERKTLNNMFRESLTFD